MGGLPTKRNSTNESSDCRGGGQDTSRAVLDEARRNGAMVPIIGWPDGRVEQGFEDSIGCFII
jgi:hypothetical protein